MIFVKSSIKMGREYSHWIDLTLISHMEAVIFKIDLTNIPCWSKPTFLTSAKGPTRYKKVQRPQNQFSGQTKRGGGRADLKNVGVKQCSSFKWTLVVKKENGKRKRGGVGKF